MKPRLRGPLEREGTVGRPAQWPRSDSSESPASRPSWTGKVTVSEAVDTLARLCRRETHSFWSMNRSVTELPSEILTRVQGYRQITDAALVGLARERRGRIATFDAGLANLQPAGRRPSVFLIPA